MKKLKGFTLVELVVVIAIILILVSIAVPKYEKSNLSAQAAAHNVNVKEIKNAAILYLIEHPNEKNVTIEKLSDYFENGIPKPAKALNQENFQISVDDNSNITVTPGTVKVNGKNLEVEK
ncbi:MULTISPECIES: competence type IV pilus major pilin ComGC [Peptoniphilus]|uniref:competence type IV pilus major pilin ComGC n=1 Tax=Peptoniphilus TaxID=162289 RepID=UPI0001DA9BBB|nr:MULTISPECIES: prepilin-type N-terminal cleavage/methylation domain-containing protein [Peptoniphilus]EFI42365.1 prepilin-type cleavage/methylation N-terminal domain protein [Peptoniphilus sp. oral taxon 386 str. F0131]